VGEPIFGMDASRISMGRLLSYLFEVTERFGMQTRTELILLQRTMVVVEGVARTLDSRMNIWDAARPVVEGYIRDSLGPTAFARDLAKSAWILARFSPRLPELARAALVRTATPTPTWRPSLLVAALYMAAGAGLGIIGVLLVSVF
jgi:ubiquinone biosynthesis protein